MGFWFVFEKTNKKIIISNVSIRLGFYWPTFRNVTTLYTLVYSILYIYGNIYNNIKYKILIDTHATRVAY